MKGFCRRIFIIDKGVFRFILMRSFYQWIIHRKYEYRSIYNCMQKIRQALFDNCMQKIQLRFWWSSSTYLGLGGELGFWFAGVHSSWLLRNRALALVVLSLLVVVDLLLLLQTDSYFLQTLSWWFSCMRRNKIAPKRFHRFPCVGSWGCGSVSSRTKEEESAAPYVDIYNRGGRLMLSHPEQFIDTSPLQVLGDWLGTNARK